VCCTQDPVGSSCYTTTKKKVVDSRFLLLGVFVIAVVMGKPFSPTRFSAPATGLSHYTAALDTSTSRSDWWRCGCCSSRGKSLRYRPEPGVPECCCKLLRLKLIEDPKLRATMPAKSIAMILHTSRKRSFLLFPQILHKRVDFVTSASFPPLSYYTGERGGNVAPKRGKCYNLSICYYDPTVKHCPWVC
jgi:hypothetical protein